MRMQLTHNIGGRFSRRSALATLVVAFVPAAVGIAFANSAASVTEPKIVSHPADPTNQTAAKLTYTDSQAGVTFECQLDGGTYTTCPSGGITYPGPLAPGTHTFRVQAVAKAKTSSAASYTWTVDTTPPTIALAFPANGGRYNAGAWSRGCPRGAGICGSAMDAHGVSSVVVSIRQGSGRWWNGAGFNATSETFAAAALRSPGADDADWTYALRLPADGSYTVHVRATDEAGNTTPAASQQTSVFTIDTTPPPPPAIVSGPERTTSADTATFAFTDGEAGVELLCAIDRRPYGRCSSPQLYSSVSLGQHTFWVWALDAAGNMSPATSYSWTVVKSGPSKPFTISGGLSELLAPGLGRTLPLTIVNPNSVPIYVTSLVVGVQPGSSKPGCDGPTNLQVTQSSASSTNALTVPAGAHVTLPSGAVSTPRVFMQNLPSNQDACKGATFAFTYSGSAHS